MPTTFSNWMSWEAGVDLVACTAPDLPMPNVIVHLARLVHTPRGSAASGLVFYQPDPAVAPLVMGFVSTDPLEVGPYFGSAIFADTPFASAPVLPATVDITVTAATAQATVHVAGLELRTELSDFGPLTRVDRAPAPMTPFWQQGLERAARRARLWVDGSEIPLLVPPVGISGGPAAVHAPCGHYAR